MKNHTMFLDWFNNFLSIGYFASHYGLSIKRAEMIIRKGYLIHESQFQAMVFEVQSDYEGDHHAN